MDTVVSNQPKQGEFFLLRPDATRGGRGHGVVFENREALLTPPRRILKPDKGGFPSMRELPRLVYIPREGDPPEDLEGGFSGYWLVSERLRRVMESVDPDAFSFSDTDYRLADGTKSGPRYLCDVVRTVDALDEEGSKLNIVVSDDYEEGKYYDLTGGIRLVFRRDVLGSAHVFRLPFHGGVFCDRAFKDAVEAAGIGILGSSDGLWFYDVVNR